MYFLWTEFGVSSLAGLVVVVLMTLVQYWNSTMSTKFRRRIANKTDERGRTMNEIIVAIRVIKIWTGGKVHLDKIDIEASGDKIIVIVGSVGYGKTTLLHPLLGELPIQTGSCLIHGRTSYACQEPWIFSGNVRQNILFGRPFDQKKYEEAAQAAALVDDFKQLINGDMALVGGRRVSLSGGQKARVNLARASYQPADIYLLDDP